MAASTPWRRTGCIVISAASSGLAMASRMVPSPRTARYSGSDRPAWRMNHTGGYGVGSPRHAARNGASAGAVIADEVTQDAPPPAGVAGHANRPSAVGVPATACGGAVGDRAVGVPATACGGAVETDAISISLDGAGVPGGAGLRACATASASILAGRRRQAGHQRGRRDEVAASTSAASGSTSCGWLLSLLALQRLPLFAVQAAVASSVAVTVVLAAFVLHDPITRRQVLVVVALGVGLVLLALSAAPDSPAAVDDLTTAALVGGVALVAVLGWVARTAHRRPRRAGDARRGWRASASAARPPARRARRGRRHPEWDVVTDPPTIAPAP